MKAIMDIAKNIAVQTSVDFLLFSGFDLLVMRKDSVLILNSNPLVIPPLVLSTLDRLDYIYQSL